MVSLTLGQGRSPLIKTGRFRMVYQLDTNYSPTRWETLRVSFV